MQTDFYKVITYINIQENSNIFGTTYFGSRREAELFAESFEDLRYGCLAVIEEIKND